jgi:type III secretion protein R
LTFVRARLDARGVMSRLIAVAIGAVLGVLGTAGTAFAQQDTSAPSQPIVTIVAVGALAILPVLFMTATSFVKIHVVFSILKNALGAGDVPSGAVIAALAAILTLYVMAPVGAEIAEEAGPAASAIDPNNPLADLDALGAAIEAGARPLKRFLDRNTAEREQSLFLDLARQARPEEQRADVHEDDLLVLLPSFLITELSEAFQIGFLVFLPFLILDLVVSNVLMSLGMHMLQPTQVSMPFKLLLFVLVDGWYLLARALVLGYS